MAKLFALHPGSALALQALGTVLAADARLPEVSALFRRQPDSGIWNLPTVLVCDISLPYWYLVSSYRIALSARGTVLTADARLPEVLRLFVITSRGRLFLARKVPHTQDVN